LFTKAILGPNELGANGEAFADEAFGDGRRVEGGVPNVSDIAGKQCPSRRPVGLDALSIWQGARFQLNEAEGDGCVRRLWEQIQ
jgi:hypothetical protein